MPAYLLETGRI